MKTWASLLPIIACSVCFALGFQSSRWCSLHAYKEHLLQDQAYLNAHQRFLEKDKADWNSAIDLIKTLQKERAGNLTNSPAFEFEVWIGPGTNGINLGGITNFFFFPTNLPPPRPKGLKLAAL